MSSSRKNQPERKDKQRQSVERGDGSAKRRARKAHLDAKLDEALEETFPASDPVELSANRD
jgi:hypothetical protein